MQISTVRTTIDLETSMARKLKEYAARQGSTQKQIISQAIRQYMDSVATEKDAQQLWADLRKLSKSGKKNIDLTTELRKDRNR